MLFYHENRDRKCKPSLMVQLGMVLICLFFISYANAQWHSLRGKAIDLSISPNGHTYALDQQGLVWHLTPGSSGWSKLPGRFKHIRATHNHQLWGIDSKQNLYQQQGSQWKKVASKIQDIAASPDGLVMILKNHKLLQYPSQRPFSPTPPIKKDQKIISLHADEHGLPWLLLSHRQAIRFDGVRWSYLPRLNKKIKQLATSINGKVVALGENNRLYQLGNKKRSWQRISKQKADRIALSPQGKPWLLDKQGRILGQTADKDNSPPPAVFTRLLSWKPMGTLAKRLDVGSDGSVFALDRDGRVWQWQQASQWSALTGKFSQITVADRNKVWAQDTSGKLHQLKSGFWSPMPGNAKHIAASHDGQLWGMVKNQLSLWNPKRQQWIAQRSLKFRIKHLSIGEKNQPWVIDNKGQVRTLVKQRWQIIKGITATSLDAGADGTVYATTDKQQIFWLDKNEQRWKPATGKATAIAVGPDGAPWAIGTGSQLMASKRFLKDRAEEQRAIQIAKAKEEQAKTKVVINAPWPLPSLFRSLSYKRLPGNTQLQHLAIGQNGSIFAINTNGGLMCFNNADQQFLLASNGSYQQVAVDLAGKPWVLGQNGIINRYQTTGWSSIPEFTAQDLSISPAGDIMAVATNNEVYELNQAFNKFELVPLVQSDSTFKAKRIAAAREDKYWVISQANQLFECKTGKCSLKLLGVQDVAVAPDNQIYILDLLGQLRTYNSQSGSFEAQNGQGVSLAVGPQGLPWIITQAGRVDYAGLFYPQSKTVNTAQCATAYHSSPQAASTGQILIATDDTANSTAGGRVNLLTNDTLNGRNASTSELNVTLLNQSSREINLDGGEIVISSQAANGSIYTGRYQICPKLSFGSCTTANFQITLNGVPDAPGSVSAIAGNASANVSFSAPANNGGSAITNYTATSTPGSISTNGAGSPIIVTGLTNGISYRFSVTATNASGTSGASSFSNNVTPTAPSSTPGAPTSVSASAGNTTANITFTAPASDGGSAIINYTATSTPGSISATSSVSPITVSGLTNGTSYQFSVIATNANGNSSSSSLSNSVTPSGITAPDAPTGVSAIGSASGADVSFTAPANNGGSAITQYTVTASPGGFTQTEPASSGTMIHMTGLTGGTFTFTVTATNAAGTSVPSAASSPITVF